MNLHNLRKLELQNHPGNYLVKFNDRQHKVVEHSECFWAAIWANESERILLIKTVFNASSLIPKNEDTLSSWVKKLITLTKQTGLPWWFSFFLFLSMRMRMNWEDYMECDFFSQNTATHLQTTSWVNSVPGSCFELRPLTDDGNVFNLDCNGATDSQVEGCNSKRKQNERADKCKKQNLLCLDDEKLFSSHRIDFLGFLSVIKTWSTRNVCVRDRKLFFQSSIIWFAARKAKNFSIKLEKSWICWF